MNVNNLSTCWAPNLIREPPDQGSIDIAQQLLDSGIKL